jgi:hypothetical protein
MPSRRLTLLFVACSAALALVPVLPAYLPLVDFPQHVALHAIWNNIHDPAFNLGGRFRVTLATPYALPHLAAHAAAQVLGAEGGLRLVLLLSLVAFPWAALALLRAFGRPDEIALAAFPAALSFVYWYGFVSYVVSLPLIVLGVAWARRCAGSGRARDACLLAALGLLTVATHAFALLVLLLLAAVAALATTRAIGRLLLTASALVPSVAWAAMWTLSTASEVPAQPLQTTWETWHERLRYGLGAVFGSYTRDPRVLAIALLLAAAMGAALWLSRRGVAGEERARHALGLVALAAVAASLLCPQVLMNTWGLWERIPPVAFVALAGALPWPAAARSRARLAVALAAVALFSSGTAIAQGLSFSARAQGIRELAEELPRGARIFWSACGDEQPWPTATPSFKHMGAYVQAARGGDLSYSFAHFNHMVVRYRGGRLPTSFDGSVYDFAVLRAGSGCPPMDELLKLGPLAVKGRYLAFAAKAVTPELAEALDSPERPARATNGSR